MPRGKQTLVSDSNPDIHQYQIEVKVGTKVVPTSKRVFKTRAGVLTLTDEQLLDRVNYAEDLFARAAITSANTPKGEKQLHRQLSAKFIFAGDDQALKDQLLASLATSDKASHEFLDSIWELHGPFDE